MIDNVVKLRNTADSHLKNRIGILLANKNTLNNTKTLTNTMWSLLNILPSKQSQKPHKHNSVALDLCVNCKEEEDGSSNVYTLMGTKVSSYGITFKYCNKG